MAKQRIINTKLWSDSWVSKLDPIEKLLWIYLLTNERTEICGVYELPLKYMAIETGIEKEMIEKILIRFEVENKISYKEGYVFIKNFLKHQSSTSEKVKIGINRCLKSIPKHVLDTLCIPYAYPIIYLNSNLNSNSNLKSDSEALASQSLEKNIITPLLAFPSNSPDIEMPEPTEDKPINKVDKRKKNLALIFELNAIAYRITGKHFLKDGKLALKQLKELEEFAKDGDEFIFGFERIRQEWIELCNEWVKADEDSYTRKYGFNLGTIRKKINNKGI